MLIEQPRGSGRKGLRGLPLPLLEAGPTLGPWPARPACPSRPSHRPAHGGPPGWAHHRRSTAGARRFQGFPGLEGWLLQGALGLCEAMCRADFPARLWFPGYPAAPAHTVCLAPPGSHNSDSHYLLSPLSNPTSAAASVPDSVPDSVHHRHPPFIAIRRPRVSPVSFHSLQHNRLPTPVLERSDAARHLGPNVCPTELHISAMSQPQLSQGGIVDPLDLLDFSEYDGLPYQSPSPSTSNKSQFPAGPATSMSITPPTLPSSQSMSGPSHQYDQYKQQTPFVPGALASTIAVNQNNADISGYNLEYMSPAEDLFDFNSNPSQTARNSEMDVDFEPSENGFYYAADTTINPNAIGASGSHLASPSMVAPPSNVGRMYPGMHQQAALAKAQAQQKQQRQIIQQQQQERQNTPAKQQRSKAPMPADPIVEQKITQLLNSMRSKANADDDDDSSVHNARTKKEEDDMDEDERLLASEEGKKLSSKERRQLRNKVSARAFRSRRKGKLSYRE